jgi:anaerobic ribonucleoside-triphosphate reductase
MSKILIENHFTGETRIEYWTQGRAAVACQAILRDNDGLRMELHKRCRSSRSDHILAAWADRVGPRVAGERLASY